MRNHHLRSEDGAIAATATVMMVALLGIAMLAIDGGQLFTSRRNVLTDTDAAALAAAREMIGEDCDLAARAAAEAVATDVLVDNDAETTTPTSPAVSCVDRMGRATVTAVRNTDLAFGGLAGIPDVDVQATSVAQYGPLSSGNGLRPIAMCNKEPHFLEFALDEGYVDEAGIKAMLADDPSTTTVNESDELWAQVQAIKTAPGAHPATGPEGAYPADSTVHRVEFARQNSALGCGGAAGNWGWLDFSGNAGNNLLRHWIEFGYDQPISLATPTQPEDCAPEDPSVSDCMGQPGAGGKSWNGALDAIHCNSTWSAARCKAERKAFPVIVFNAVCTGSSNGNGNGNGNPNAGGGASGGDPNCDGGNGNEARYDHVAFLGLILRDWEPITGNMNVPSWFAFEFVNEFITSGTITGTPSAIGPGLVGVQLCGGGYAATVDDYCVVP